MAEAIFAVCNTLDQAERIIEELREAGFGRDDISMLLPDASGRKDFARVTETRGPTGAATGAGAGGVLGGGLGWLMGIGALAIPGAGPFIAAGPLFGALTGAAVGAAVGGVTGALIGMGIPEQQAKRLEGLVREGSILLSVHADVPSRLERAREVLEAGGCHDVVRSQAKTGPGRRPHV